MGQCPCGKVLPITMEPTSKVFLDAHCKGEHHTHGLRYGKMVADFFPLVLPRDASPLRNVISHVNRKPDLQVFASARGAWATTVMAAFAHFKPDCNHPQH